MKFLLIIKCSRRGVACATTEIIKGRIARADDIVVQNCEEVLVNTNFPNEFVNAFYANGFDNKMEIQPCVE